MATISEINHLHTTKPRTEALCQRSEKVRIGARGREAYGRVKQGQILVLTPWSRTKFQPILKFVEFCCFQLIDTEPVASRVVESVDLD